MKACFATDGFGGKINCREYAKETKNIKSLPDKKEQGGYNMYRPKNCKKCGGRMRQTGGIQTYTQANTPQGATTPTGRSNLATLTPEQIRALAGQYGFRTDSNANLQQDLFNYAQKNQPQAYQNMVSQYGPTAAGTFVDNMLGARTSELLQSLPAPQSQQQAQPQPYRVTSTFNEHLYGPGQRALGAASNRYRDSYDVTDAGMVDTGNPREYVNFQYYKPNSTELDAARGTYRIPNDVYMNQIARGTNTIANPALLDPYRIPDNLNVVPSSSTASTAPPPPAIRMKGGLIFKMKGGRLVFQVGGSAPKQQQQGSPTTPKSPLNSPFSIARAMEMLGTGEDRVGVNPLGTGTLPTAGPQRQAYIDSLSNRLTKIKDDYKFMRDLGYSEIEAQEAQDRGKPLYERKWTDRHYMDERRRLEQSLKGELAEIWGTSDYLQQAQNPITIYQPRDVVKPKRQMGGVAPRQQDYPDYESWQAAMDNWQASQQGTPTSAPPVPPVQSPMMNAFDNIQGVQGFQPTGDMTSSATWDPMSDPNTPTYAQAQRNPPRPNNNNPYAALQRVGLGMMAARTGLSEISGRIERGRQNQYDYQQQTALGMMNPMQSDDFQPNPYNLYMQKGGNLKTILRDYNKYSNDAQFDFGSGDNDQGMIPQMKKGGYEIDRMIIVRKLLPELLKFGRLGSGKYRNYAHGGNAAMEPFHNLSPEQYAQMLQMMQMNQGVLPVDPNNPMEGFHMMEDGTMMPNSEMNYRQGGIHIKKKNRGKFTEYCGGKVTEECIQKGLNSSNPTTRKRANFARNARKWN